MSWRNMSDLQNGLSSLAHSCSSYTPLRMVLAAVTGHLRTSPAFEKQYGAPSSDRSSAASALSAASGLFCGREEWVGGQWRKDGGVEQGAPVQRTSLPQ